MSLIDGLRRYETLAEEGKTELATYKGRAGLRVSVYAFFGWLALGIPLWYSKNQLLNSLWNLGLLFLLVVIFGYGSIFLQRARIKYLPILGLLVTALFFYYFIDALRRLF